MKNILSIYHRFMRWLKGSTTLTDVLAVAQPPPPKVTIGARDSSFGEFYFRETILDDLDAYFEILERMRKVDNDAYHFCNKLGANLLPNYSDVYNQNWKPGSPFNQGGLLPWWKGTMPMFGAVVLPNLKKLAAAEQSNKKHWFPKLMYYRKYSRRGSPLVVEQRSGVTVYCATVYWYDSEKMRGAPTEFPVAVDSKGNVSILKTKITDNKIIQGRSGCNRAQKINIPAKRWGHADQFIHWAHTHGEEPETYLKNIFLEMAYSHEASQYSMIRVEARKGNLMAAFGVDITRTPYFFKDRDVSVGSGGRRKRIFHIVRAHTRKNGKFVKTHFRGEREFLWNGYNIVISVHGRDHHPFIDVTVGMTDSERLTDTERLDKRTWYDAATSASRIRKALETMKP